MCPFQWEWLLAQPVPPSAKPVVLDSIQNLTSLSPLPALRIIQTNSSQTPTVKGWEGYFVLWLLQSLSPTDPVAGSLYSHGMCSIFLSQKIAVNLISPVSGSTDFKLFRTEDPYFTNGL